MGFPTSYAQIKWVLVDTNTLTEASFSLFFTKETGSAPTQVHAQAYANAWQAAYSAEVLGCLPSSVHVQHVLATWINGVEIVEGQSLVGGAVGTVSGDTLPEEDAVVLQRRTGMRGPRRRGRIFMPFVPEDFQNKGELNGDAQDAYGALCVKLAEVRTITATETGTYQPVHINHVDGVAIDITQWKLVLQVCNQRRRRFPKKLQSVAFS